MYHDENKYDHVIFFFYLLILGLVCAWDLNHDKCWQWTLNKILPSMLNQTRARLAWLHMPLVLACILNFCSIGVLLLYGFSHFCILQGFYRKAIVLLGPNSAFSVHKRRFAVALDESLQRLPFLVVFTVLSSGWKKKK